MLDPPKIAIGVTEGSIIWLIPETNFFAPVDPSP